MSDQKDFLVAEASLLERINLYHIEGDNEGKKKSNIRQIFR
jgi:hypothetical protein